jgi:hypothetical protein
MGNPLESVSVGQDFFLRAVVTDLRPDGALASRNARGAVDAFIDIGSTARRFKWTEASLFIRCLPGGPTP